MKHKTIKTNTGDKLRKDYISAKLAEAKVRFPSTSFDEAIIEELLEICETDEELDEQNPKEYFIILEEICADIARTHGENITELSIVEAAKNISPSDALAHLRQKFDFGDSWTQFRPKPGVTIDERELAMGAGLGFELENTGRWIVADALGYLMDMGKEDVVVQICAELNRSYMTVSNWIRTAKRVKENRDALPFTVYAEIATAKYDDDKEVNEKKIKELVDRAVNEKWDSTQARQHVSLEKGKQKPIKETYRYLLILNGEPLLCNECPAWSEGAIVIDLKENQWLRDVEGKIEWCEMAKEPTHKEIKPKNL